MIKEGQVYKEINNPEFRQVDKRKFVITRIEFISAYVVYEDGETDTVGLRYVEGDCKLVKEYKSWKEAVSEL